MRSWLFRIWNLWPPWFGAGIVIDKVSPDFMHIRTRLKKRFWTLNLIRTQYGGSMFSMIDPIYMAMLSMQLGKEYRVIDKSASIEFKRLGKTDLIADFRLSASDLAEIKRTLDSQEKFDWQRSIDIVDKNGEVVAKAVKTISIKKRKPDTAS